MLAKSKGPARDTISKQTMPFRWRYIILPVAILLLSIVLTVFFYPLLPSEVAYHFEGDSPDKWTSRGAITAWTLTPQLFFTLMARGIIWGIIKLSARFQQTGTNRVWKILSLMGNMIALPQIILGFAMLDIFSYNSYQIHLLPLWLFALIVMIMGGVIIGIFFILAIREISGTARGSTR